LRVLEVMKSNYGPIGETITLKWNKGLFLPIGGASALEKAAAERAAEQMFLTLLTRFNRQGRNVSDKPNAHGYAPASFVADPEAKAAHISKHALADAMRRLFAANKIRVETYGRPSRPYSRLVIEGG
jgi:RecA-family ATPase